VDWIDLPFGVQPTGPWPVPNVDGLMTKRAGSVPREADEPHLPSRAVSTGRAASAGRRPLNILMVTAWSPKQDVGGVSTVIQTLAAELSRRHSIQVLVNDWRARQLIETQEAGVRCHRLWLRTPYVPDKVLIGLAAWIIWFPRILLQLRRLLQREAIDVVHLHFASAYQFYFRILRMLGGPPYIVTLHRGDTVSARRMAQGYEAVYRAVLA
jgi:glycosyltransferase involved in cell wall biosynthesis